MATEHTILTRGRYRDKTYGYVFEHHRDYCEIVREAAEKKGHIPVDDEFIDFLRAKSCEVNRSASNVICEQTTIHFLKAATQDMKSELRELLGVHVVTERQIHPSCQLEHTNGFLGVFYRYFIKKCVFNLRDEDGYNTYIDHYATIFPFAVHKDERSNSGRIRYTLNTLRRDVEFRSKIQSFLNAHFDEDIDYDEIVQVFLSNIDRFQSETDMDLKQLESVVKNESNRPIDGSGDRFGSFRRGKQHSYLESFPRLNEEGARRYSGLYSCYEQVLNLEGRRFVRDHFSSHKLNFFSKLPERNFYELLSLLDTNLFRDNIDVYTEWFQKYLFFFIGALKSDPHPIFFIDDVLFECLKSLQKFRKSRRDPCDLLTELRMMTLVHRRKQACDKTLTPDGYAVDLQHLERVKDYIENFPGIETAKVEYDVPHRNLLESRALFCLEDTVMDVRFSKIRKGAISEFYESFLMAALCESPIIENLVVYNAYTGIEYSVRLNDTFDRAAVREFIRKYNEWDFSKPNPPEKAFTWGWEECFVPGTIDWEEKREARSKP